MPGKVRCDDLLAVPRPVAMLGLLGEKPLPPKEALGAGECNRGALAGGDGQVVRGMVFCGVATPGSILTCCIAEPEAEDSDFPDIVGIVNGLLGADLKPAFQTFPEDAGGRTTPFSMLPLPCGETLWRRRWNSDNDSKTSLKFC